MIIKCYTKKGSTNVVAEALSRMPEDHLKVISVFNNDLLQRIKYSWVEDPALVALLHKLKNSVGVNPKYTWVQ